jgi:hypothetical protein
LVYKNPALDPPAAINLVISIFNTLARSLPFILATEDKIFQEILRGEAMKRYITSFLMMAMLAVVIPFASATSASAQTRRYYRSAPVYTQQYTQPYRRPNVYQRHRNLINIGIGTAAGALIGGLLGGGKGAGIGALVGAGGSALYSYKLNPKTRRYYRVYR